MVVVMLMVEFFIFQLHFQAVEYSHEQLIFAEALCPGSSCRVGVFLQIVVCDLQGRGAGCDSVWEAGLGDSVTVPT